MYHLKLVGRQIFQRKGYFVINTIGLAVALTASIFIYTFLVKEWQTNTYHENIDHIYRITVQHDGNTHWGRGLQLAGRDCQSGTAGSD